MTPRNRFSLWLRMAELVDKGPLADPNHPFVNPSLNRDRWVKSGLGTGKVADDSQLALAVGLDPPYQE